MKPSILISVAISMVLLSCGRPECNTTNPIFISHAPSSPAYKKELITRLQDVNREPLSYWFAGYAVENSKEYLKFDVQGEGICANGLLEVRDWDEKVENIRRVKGKSYKGAELRGLRFTVEGNNLVYQGLDRIID